MARSAPGQTQASESRREEVSWKETARSEGSRNWPKHAGKKTGKFSALVEQCTLPFVQALVIAKEGAEAK